MVRRSRASRESGQRSLKRIGPGLKREIVVELDFLVLVQMRFPTYQPSWIAGITTTPLQPSPVPGSISIILDIDISRESDIPMHPDKLWPVIDEVRSIKNDLFERAITEKTKALFR